MSIVTRVKKRSGEYEAVSFDKILNRIKEYSIGLKVDPVALAKDVIDRIHDGIETRKLDVLTARKAHNKVLQHPDWDILAANIAISNHQKETIGIFSEVIRELHEHGLIDDKLYCIVLENEADINDAIDYTKDFHFPYLGFKKFEQTYSLRIKEEGYDGGGGEGEGRPVERLQDMFMRVSLGIHQDDIESAIESYKWMSNGYFIHATPTLFNAGTKKPQCSSCFLLSMKEEETAPVDSIDKIYETLSDCAKISKSSGGIGVSISNVRNRGSMIKTAGRPSDGIVPMLKVFNETARYADQGRKRKGAFAIYLEPWHPDVYEFLELKDNQGKDELRARDLFYAMWIPDLFMHRVSNDEMWSLMDPVDCPELINTHSKEFEKYYLKYEKEGTFVRRVKARDLYEKIITSQIQTGVPYMLYKDQCNMKSNQKNLGTIRSSNLCAEIVEYSDNNEIAVCNLASIGLPRYVEENEDGNLYFDFESLYYVTKMITRNLNKIIDINYYPIKEAKFSNLKNRPIGIGVQGLANVFIEMGYPFESEKAKELNVDIFETIYFAALEASCELAEENGPYDSYEGSPISEGKLQFDLWDELDGTKTKLSQRWNWTKLRLNIQEFGVRNSLLVALMPTASTSFLFGYNESFEPFTSNFYTLNMLGGTYKIVNKKLISDLIDLGLWTKEVKNQFLSNNGSIQNITCIPDHIKQLYKTVWEIKQRTVIDMAADRGRFVDQSQSMNIYVANPDHSIMGSVHMYGWKKGLKTGQYYLRSRPAVDAIKTSVTVEKRKDLGELADLDIDSSGDGEDNQIREFNSHNKSPASLVEPAHESHHPRLSFRNKMVAKNSTLGSEELPSSSPSSPSSPTTPNDSPDKRMEESPNDVKRWDNTVEAEPPIDDEQDVDEEIVGPVCNGEAGCEACGS